MSDDTPKHEEVPKMKTTWVYPIALMASTFAYAVDDSEFESCAKINADPERLLCFDNLAEKDSPNKQPNNIGSDKNVGDWLIDVDVNPVDDSTTVTLILEASEGFSAYGDPIYILARCMSGDTDVFISWDDYLGREANVLTRVGDEQAVTQRWSMSTDQTATFHPQPVNFLQDMMSATRLVAQITPYNESPTTAVFKINGLSEAIEPLRQECGW